MKRIWLGVAVCMLCLCAACGKQPVDAGDDKQPTGAEGQVISATPSVSDGAKDGQGEGTGEGTGQKETITSIEDLEKEAAYMMQLGDECANNAQNRMAIFFYSIAATHVSSMRYMVDCVLWMKGEGNTIADLTKDRLADWKTIGALNYAGCYADYCQYLLNKMQDKTDEATTFYNRATLNPDCPPEDAFYEYKDRSVEDLYAIKSRLEALEDQIFACYKPYTDPLEQISGYEYMPEFHVTLASFYLRKNDVDNARRSLERAINVDPFNGSYYAMAAYTALGTGDSELMVAYLDEGLLHDPASASLHAMLAVVARSTKDTENEKYHMDIVNSSEKDAFTEQILALLQE